MEILLGGISTECKYLNTGNFLEITEIQMEVVSLDQTKKKKKENSDFRC